MQLGVVFGSVRHVNTEVGKCLVVGLQHNIVVHMCIYIIYILYVLYTVHIVKLEHIKCIYIYWDIVQLLSKDHASREIIYQLDSDCQ